MPGIGRPAAKALGGFLEQHGVFVKTAPTEQAALAEVEGLRALRAVGELNIPTLIAQQGSRLQIAFVAGGRRNDTSDGKLGRQLARHHRIATSSYFGYEQDNFIGLAPQYNEPVKFTEDCSWPQFYWRMRLQKQLAMIQGKGRSLGQLAQLLQQAKPEIFHLLASPEPPCLIHGDLWAGNYLVDDKGEPWVIDPAVCFAHRELELAMTSLFGGFGPRFYENYEQEYPLAPGYLEREPLYQLYHVLNHYNIFGGGYLSQAESLLRPYT